MQAAGRTPSQLEEALKGPLANYISDPQVTVIVQTINSRKFNILGQVNKSGSFLLTADTTIVDAIALAGGLREFAKKKGIYVIRRAQTERRYASPSTIRPSSREERIHPKTFCLSQMTQSLYPKGRLCFHGPKLFVYCLVLSRSA